MIHYLHRFSWNWIFSSIIGFQVLMIIGTSVTVGTFVKLFVSEGYNEGSYPLLLILLRHHAYTFLTIPVFWGLGTIYVRYREDVLPLSSIHMFLAGIVISVVLVTFGTEAIICSAYPPTPGPIQEIQGF